MNTMNSALIQQIKLVADEKKIPRDNVADSLKDAIIKAYVKEFPETEVEVIINVDDGILEVNQLLKVVEPYEDLNDYTEIALNDAKKHNANITIGEVLKLPVDVAKLERPVQSHIFQIFKHNIVNQSNVEIFKTWKPRIGEVIFTEVEKVDNRSGFVTVNLEDTFGFLSNHDRIPGELLVPGKKYNFYIKDVKEQTKGWPIILSRADAGLIKYLLRLQIPEIQEGIIEIKDIARIAGFKTKLSVLSHQGGVEPVGTIIGPRGSRIRSIQDQIHNEHIEVVEYTDDFDRYIVSVCSPGEIAGVAIQEPKTVEERRQITLVCKSDKLALLIGKKGANVRLISEMLKSNIEIQSIEEAHQSGLVYKKIDVQSMQKQAFNRTFNKYRPNTDILSKYNTANRSSYRTSKVIENMVNETKAPISKKEKASFLDDFKSMNKDELLNELSSGNINDDTSDDINVDDYENHK